MADVETSQQLRLIPLAGSTSSAPVVVDSDQPILMGRATECDVCLSDASCSRRHLILTRRDDRWSIEDLDSRHGTFVNGVRVGANKQVPIRHGDMLRAGTTTFRVDLVTAAPRTLAAMETSVSPGTIIEAVAPRELESLAQQRLALLIEGCSALYEARTESELAEAVVSLIMAGTGYPRAAMLSWAQCPDEVEIVGFRDGREATADGFVFSRSLLRAVEGGQMARLSRSDLGQWGQSIAGLGIAAALCAPLIVDSVVVGAIYLDSRAGETRSQTDAPGFCHTVAHIASLALCNLKRLELAQRQEQLDADLTIAQEAQSFLLPKASGVVGAVRYASRTRPGSVVGGDLFDIFPIGEGRIGICFGDITGHGIGAAILMTAVLSHLRASLTNCGHAGAAVTETNAYLVAHSADRMFATLWVGVLDVAEGSLEFVDAGHGHWLICPNGGTPRCPDSPGDLIIGVQPGLVYSQARIEFRPGDRLILYSDGLVEQPNREGDRFGTARLVDVIAGSDSIDRDVSGVFAALETFTGSDRFADDTTIASIEVSPSPRASDVRQGE